jgi:hypothetical protein
MSDTSFYSRIMNADVLLLAGYIKVDKETPSSEINFLMDSVV